MIYGSCLLCPDRVDNDNILCDECLRFALFLKRKCSRCGAFSIIDGLNGCGSCNGRKIWFDSIFTPYLYCGSISNLISTMKYGKNISYAAILGNHLASLLDKQTFAGSTVIFPPMSFFNKLKRSFNQSEIFAEKIGAKLNLKIEKDLLTKIKKTKPQASLTYDKRLKNLEGAFKLKKDLKDKDFLLVDDVCTTFSTVNIIAELLKKNGAKNIKVVTLARTSPYFG